MLSVMLPCGFQSLAPTGTYCGARSQVHVSSTSRLDVKIEDIKMSCLDQRYSQPQAGTTLEFSEGGCVNQTPEFELKYYHTNNSMLASMRGGKIELTQQRCVARQFDAKAQVAFGVARNNFTVEVDDRSMKDTVEFDPHR